MYSAYTGEYVGGPGVGGGGYGGGGYGGGCGSFAYGGEAPQYVQQYDAGGGDYDYEDEEDDLVRRSTMLDLLPEVEKLRYAKDLTSRNRRCVAASAAPSRCAQSPAHP